MTNTEKLARKLARAWINENRFDSGLPSLSYISSIWWKAYGHTFLEQAEVDLFINKSNKRKINITN